MGGDGDADLPARRAAGEEETAGHPFGVVGNGERADAYGPDGELLRVEGANRPRQGGPGEDPAGKRPDVLFVQEDRHLVTCAAGDGGRVDVVPVEVGDQHGIDVLPRVPALGERLGEPPLGGKPGVHQQDRTSVLDEHEVPGTAASQRPDGESATQGSEAPARIAPKRKNHPEEIPSVSQRAVSDGTTCSPWSNRASTTLPTFPSFLYTASRTRAITGRIW